MMPSSGSGTVADSVGAGSVAASMAGKIAGGVLSVIGKERVREEWLVTGSMILHGLTALLFIAGAQTYAASFLFVLLVIKALLLIKSDDTNRITNVTAHYLQK